VGAGSAREGLVLASLVAVGSVGAGDVAWAVAFGETGPGSVGEVWAGFAGGVAWLVVDGEACAPSLDEDWAEFVWDAAAGLASGADALGVGGSANAIGANDKKAAAPSAVAEIRRMLLVMGTS